MVTIAQERAKLAAVGLKLRTREQAGFRFNYTTARSVIEPAVIQEVHITVTNPKNYNSDDAHARAVEAIGISRFPNTGVSYNRLIMQSGTVYEGQPMGRRGAHTVNDFKRPTCTTSGCPSRGTSLQGPDWNLNYNARAYAICQNLGDPVTEKQLDAAAREMAADRLAGLVTLNASIHGHRCGSPKECPGPLMWALMGRLEQLVSNYLRTGLNPPPPQPEEWFEMATEQQLRQVVKDEIKAVSDTISALAAKVDAVPTAEENRREFWEQPIYDTISNETLPSFTEWLMERLRRDTARAASYSLQALNKIGGPIDVNELAAAIVAKLPPGGADAATVETALRRVLGSLDEE